jgi:hypothetical protein
MEPTFLVTRYWEICDCSQFSFALSKYRNRILIELLLKYLTVKHISFILYAFKKVPLHIVPVKEVFERVYKKPCNPFIYKWLMGKKK